MRECGKQANVVGRAGKIINFKSEIKKTPKSIFIKESEGYKNEDTKIKKSLNSVALNNF